MSRGVAIVALGITIFSASVVKAGPIIGSTGTAGPGSESGTASEEEGDRRRQQGGASGTALFDLSGLPILQLGAPIYVALGGGPRSASSPLIASDIVAGLASGLSSSAAASGMGNVSGGGGGGSGGGGGTIDQTNSVLLGGTAIPEPATVLLLVPGLTLAARRWARARTGARLA
jgi:hypothetical protein